MEAGPNSAREVLRRGSNQPPDRSTSAPHLARTSIAPQAISQIQRGAMGDGQDSTILTLFENWPIQ